VSLQFLAMHVMVGVWISDVMELRCWRHS